MEVRASPSSIIFSLGEVQPPTQELALRVSSRAAGLVAFKISTTTPVRYSVRPNCGFMELIGQGETNASGECTISVGLREFKRCSPGLQDMFKVKVVRVASQDGSRSAEDAKHAFEESDKTDCCCVSVSVSMAAAAATGGLARLISEQPDLEGLEAVRQHLAQRCELLKRECEDLEEAFLNKTAALRRPTTFPRRFSLSAILLCAIVLFSLIVTSRNADSLW